MQLNRPLGPLKSSPIEHGRTQLNDRRIQGPQRMLEPEPPAFESGHGLTLGKNLVEECFVQLPGAMGIGIRERRASRCAPHAEVNQLAEGGRQAAANFAERMRTAHLAKHHRDKMLPATEPLRRALSGVLPDGTGEVRAIDQGEDLRKATGDGYHTVPPACGWHGAETPWMGGEHRPILLTSRRHFKNLFWTSVLPTPFLRLLGLTIKSAADYLCCPAQESTVRIGWRV